MNLLPKVVWISLLVAGFFLSLTPASTAQKAQIRHVAVVKSGDGLQIEIQTSQRVMPLTQVVTDPDRLIIDFSDTVPGPELRALTVNKGAVKGVRIGRVTINPPVTRVVVDLKAPLPFQLFPSSKSVIVKLGEASTVVAAESVDGTRAGTSARRAPPRPRAEIVSSSRNRRSGTHEHPPRLCENDRGGAGSGSGPCCHGGNYGFPLASGFGQRAGQESCCAQIRRCHRNRNRDEPARRARGADGNRTGPPGHRLPAVAAWSAAARPERESGRGQRCSGGPAEFEAACNTRGSRSEISAGLSGVSFREVSDREAARHGRWVFAAFVGQHHGSRTAAPPPPPKNIEVEVNAEDGKLRLVSNKASLAEVLNALRTQLNADIAVPSGSGTGSGCGCSRTGYAARSDFEIAGRLALQLHHCRYRRGRE